MAEMTPLLTLYNDLMSLIEGVVIKYKSKADSLETAESKRNGDLYCNAYLELDSFKTYPRYEISILKDIFGHDNDYVINKYYYDPSLIPYDRRNDVLIAQRRYILDNYEEHNNYYRMLAGLPDIGEDESKYVYPAEEYEIKFGIPHLPLHELDSNHINILESIGYMDKVIKENPTKKYLNYLGDKSINIVDARRAKNFAILRMISDVTDTSWQSFALIYEQCREYFCTVIYIPEYKNTIAYYDNFIALCIMVMTIQQIFARVLKDVSNRDFFDTVMMKSLYGVYNIPYFDYMDINTKKRIMQAINLLIQNKGTNKVLFDIANLLGFNRINIYKYILMRSRNFDRNGVPITAYKEDPETGETVLDYEAMYDVYFQKLNIKEEDVYKHLTDTSRRCEYDEITGDDPFWYNDSAVFDEIYKTSYNYVETKYLSVSISYRMTQILFENIYLLKTIFEMKEDLEYGNVELYIPSLNMYAPISLFDAVVALCAITCKQNNLRGEILCSPTKIMHVVGFNFNTDFALIKEEILNNPYLDDELCKFLRYNHTFTAAQLNDLFNDMLNMHDFITKKMADTNSIDEYHAYSKLYYSLYYTDENRKMFNIGTEEDPVYADTFLEYLEYANNDIYNMIMETSTEELYVLINQICNKLTAVVRDLKYIGFYAKTADVMEAMLVELITFFKSYTTDMLGLSVVYIFDMKPELILRFIDEIESLTVNMEMDERFLLGRGDNLTYSTRFWAKDYLHLADEIYLLTTILYLSDKLEFIDKIKYILKELIPKEKLNMYDILAYISKLIFISDKALLEDKIDKLNKLLLITDKLSFEDKIKRIHSILYTDENLNIYDTSHIIKKEIHESDSFNLKDKLYTLIDNINLSDLNEYIDDIRIHSHINMNDMILLYDNIHILIKTIMGDDFLFFDDSIKSISGNITYKERLPLVEKISYNKPINMDDKSELYDVVSSVKSDIRVREKFGFRDTINISWS